MDLIRGPTKARTGGRRIMGPSQTINHNSPHQPATVRPVDRCSERVESAEQWSQRVNQRT